MLTIDGRARCGWSTERDALQAQNDRLRHLLLKLRRLQFGASRSVCRRNSCNWASRISSRRSPKSEAEAEKRDPELRKNEAAKRRASRGALPAHLPRIEVMLAPEDTACPCCRAAMTVIGEDTLGAAGRDPGAVPGDRDATAEAGLPGLRGTVVQTPAPARLIEGGIPTEALVAHVLVARYADHLPLYRQAQILARQGVMLDRVHAVVLDGLCRGRDRPGGGAAAGDDAGLDADLRRRDRRAGARPGTRADEAGLLLGDRA